MFKDYINNTIKNDRKVKIEVILTNSFSIKAYKDIIKNPICAVINMLMVSSTIKIKGQQ
jgi:hypothetical protein